MNRKISFDSILDSIVDKNSISKVFARSLVNEMSAIIQQGLLRDNVVNLSGLGIFKLHAVAERPGRNIQTGETITIPAHRKVLFKPEKHLRELINKKFQMLSPKILEDIAEKPVAPKPVNVEGENAAKDTNVKPAFFTEAFDKFNEKTELSESPKIEKLEKEKVIKEEIAEKPAIEKELPVEEKKQETPEASKEESKERSMAPLIYSIIAVLIIIFLFIQFSGDEAQIETTVKQEKEVVQDKEKVVTKKEIPPAKPQEMTYTKYSAQKGDNLWNLAYKNYNDGYLWPLILQANASKIKNPDLIEPGTVLTLPVLQKDKKLSAAQSKDLVKGHILAYQAYKKFNKKEAINYLFVAYKYDPEYVRSSLAEIDNSDLEAVKNLTFGSVQ